MKTVRQLRSTLHSIRTRLALRIAFSTQAQTNSPDPLTREYQRGARDAYQTAYDMLNALVYVPSSQGSNTP